MAKDDSAALYGAPLLSAIGECLYGAEWRSPLARDLGVNLRNLQRWVDGSQQPRDWSRIFAELVPMLRQRQEELRETQERISALLDRLTA